jgi:hypothetical protein
MFFTIHIFLVASLQLTKPETLFKVQVIIEGRDEASWYPKLKQTLEA